MAIRKLMNPNHYYIFMRVSCFLLLVNAILLILTYIWYGNNVGLLIFAGIFLGIRGGIHFHHDTNFAVFIPKIDGRMIHSQGVLIKNEDLEELKQDWYESL